MVGQDLHALADGQLAGRTVAGPAQPAVLLRELVQLPSRKVDHQAVATGRAGHVDAEPVVADRLGSGVQDGPVGLDVADHRVHHPGRAALETHHAAQHLPVVVEGIDARTDLRDAVHSGGVPGGGAGAHRHHVDVESPGLQLVGGGDHQLPGVDRSVVQALLAGLGVGVALMGDQPPQAQPRQGRDGGPEVGGLAGRHTAAVIAGVDDDQHVGDGARGRHARSQRLGAGEGVHREQDPRSLHEPPGTGDLGVPHDRVGHDEAVEAGVGECLSLAQLGDAEHLRSGGHLQLGDLGCAVGLGVGRQADAAAGRVRGHVGDVVLHPGSVHHQRGCLDALGDVEEATGADRGVSHRLLLSRMSPR